MARTPGPSGSVHDASGLGAAASGTTGQSLLESGSPSGEGLTVASKPMETEASRPRDHAVPIAPSSPPSSPDRSRPLLPSSDELTVTGWLLPLTHAHAGASKERERRTRRGGVFMRRRRATGVPWARPGFSAGYDTARASRTETRVSGDKSITKSKEPARPSLRQVVRRRRLPHVDRLDPHRLGVARAEDEGDVLR